MKSGKILDNSLSSVSLSSMGRRDKKGRRNAGCLWVERFRSHSPIPESVKQFAEERGMLLSQQNGQRIFGPKKIYRKDSSKGSRKEYNWMPCKGSEVFVGKLPRNCYEMEIVPHFEKVGRIYQLRLMMNYSGNNRGFCFISYFTPEHANQAVEILDKSEIRRGWKIGVIKSLDNCKLLIGGLPMYKTEKDILNQISSLTEGVVGIQTDWRRTNRRNGSDEDWKMGPKGAVMVTYDSHRAAAMARSRLCAMNVRLWGCKIYVDWAKPEAEVLPPYFYRKTPQVLRVGNLPVGLRNTTQLANVFNEASNNGVQCVKILHRRGIIFFESREHAEMARASLHGKTVDGKRIFVDWFDPDLLETSIKRRKERQRRRRFVMRLRKQPTPPKTSTSLVYLKQNVTKDYTTRGGANDENQVTEVKETTTTTLMCSTPILNNSSPPCQFCTQFNYPPSPPPVVDPVYTPTEIQGMESLPPPHPGYQEAGPLPYGFYYPTNVMMPVVEVPIPIVPFTLPCACPACQALVSIQNLRLY